MGTCALLAASVAFGQTQGVIETVDYNWVTSTLSTALTGGTAAAISFSPCPVGIPTGAYAPSDTARHYIFINDLGTPANSESVPLIGSPSYSCTGGTATVAFTPVNSHSSYTLGSATAGIQEAVSASISASILAAAGPSIVRISRGQWALNAPVRIWSTQVAITGASTSETILYINYTGHVPTGSAPFPLTEVCGTLSGGISSTTDTFSLAASLNLAGYTILIDNELMWVASTSGTTVNIVSATAGHGGSTNTTTYRGINGTIAASHSSGAPVCRVPQAIFFYDIPGPTPPTCSADPLGTTPCEPQGPAIENFTLVAYQPPSPANREALNWYPWLIADRGAGGLSRGRISHIRAEGLWDGIRYRLINGAFLDHVELSVFSQGISMDGVYDVLRIDNLSCIELDMVDDVAHPVDTPQTEIYFGGADAYTTGMTCIDAGRVDDLMIGNFKLYGRRGITAHPGFIDANPTVGNISNADFDTGDGIVMTSGYLTCSGCCLSNTRRSA